VISVKAEGGGGTLKRQKVRTLSQGQPLPMRMCNRGQTEVPHFSRVRRSGSYIVGQGRLSKITRTGYFTFAENCRKLPKKTIHFVGLAHGWFLPLTSPSPTCGRRCQFDEAFHCDSLPGRRNPIVFWVGADRSLSRRSERTPAARWLLISLAHRSDPGGLVFTYQSLVLS
jgi:hypothetical protein